MDSPAPLVVIAADKFKGSLPAAEVASNVAAGLRAVVPDVRIVVVPVADGGDGTVEAAVSAGFTRVSTSVTGPVGDTVSADLATRDGTAVVELAQASGLVLLGSPAALEASSYGTGELIRAAYDRGCRRIVLGLGGSACTDGGAGMLCALGIRLYDESGAELPLGGGALHRLDRVDVSGLEPWVRELEVVVATDVDNPLLGPTGAAAVFGPQKGATPASVEVLEAGLRRWASLVALPVAALPGSGAAGGVGFAALAFLGASVRSGVELLLELADFPARLTDAALVVTGEGRLDEQTLHGKAVLGVARAAGARRIPVVAVVGQSTLAASDLAEIDVQQAYALTELESDPERCMAKAAPLLRRLGERIASERLANR